MKNLITSILIVIIFLLATFPALARSGCCSHHSGVRADGCGCNDGTPLSSTCAPYYSCSYSAPVNTPTPIPTATPYPTNTPTPMPTDTPIPTITPTPISDSQNPTQEVAGASTSSNDSFNSTILGLLVLSGIFGGIYYKNKKDKSKISKEN